VRGDFEIARRTAGVALGEWSLAGVGEEFSNVDYEEQSVSHASLSGGVLTTGIGGEVS
jgi:hypothetical protein